MNTRSRAEGEGGRVADQEQTDAPPKTGEGERGQRQGVLARQRRPARRDPIHTSANAPATKGSTASRRRARRKRRTVFHPDQIALTGMRSVEYTCSGSQIAPSIQRKLKQAPARRWSRPPAKPAAMQAPFFVLFRSRSCGRCRLTLWEVPRPSPHAQESVLDNVSHRILVPLRS